MNVITFSSEIRLKNDKRKLHLATIKLDKKYNDGSRQTNFPDIKELGYQVKAQH